MFRIQYKAFGRLHIVMLYSARPFLVVVLTLLLQKREHGTHYEPFESHETYALFNLPPGSSYQDHSQHYLTFASLNDDSTERIQS